MASQTELESMIVRLLGDGSSYQKMMTDAAKQSQQAADKVQAAGKRIEDIANQTKQFASAAVGALASLGLAVSVKGAFDAYSDWEKTIIRVKNAIEASGQAVGPTLAHYNALTQEIMASTTATRGEITALIEKAQNMGKTGQAVDNLVKNSLAFAAATNQSAESGFNLAHAFEIGDARMIKFALGLRRFHGTDAEVMRIAQQRLAAGFKDMADFADTAGGRLQKLGRTFKDLTVVIGGLVAKALQPAIDALEKFVNWVNQLDPRIKQLIVLVTSLTLLVASFGPILALLTPLFTALLGPIKLLMTVVAFLAPLVGGLWSAWALVAAAVLAVGAAVAVFVVKMNGVGAAWEWIKDKGTAAWGWIKKKAVQFWDWLYPVVQAAESLLTSVWEAVSEAATAAWDWIVEVVTTAWNTIVAFLDASGITAMFDEMRDKVQAVFIFAEFVVRNFSKVWKYVWTGAQLQFIVLADTLIDFFVNKIPAILTWFGSEWKNVFIDIFNLTTTAMKNNITNQVTLLTNLFNWITENGPKAFKVFDRVMQNLARNLENFGKNFVKIFEALPDLVKGKTTLAKLGLFDAIDLSDRVNEQFSKIDLTKGIKALDDGFIRKARELHLPERVIGPLEANIREQYEALGRDVAISFADFYTKKLAEFALAREGANKAAGVKLAQGVTAGAQGEIKKLQSILRFGAEAVAHIADYVEALRKINAPAGGTGGGGNAPGNPFAPPVAGGNAPPVLQPNANPNDNRRDGLLRVIAVAITAMAQQQNINVPFPANL